VPALRRSAARHERRRDQGFHQACGAGRPQHGGGRLRRHRSALRAGSPAAAIPLAFLQQAQRSMGRQLGQPVAFCVRDSNRAARRHAQGFRGRHPARRRRVHRRRLDPGDERGASQPVRR
jgi:hypothetical protein